MDELRSGLELATDDELHVITELLFQPKFNPLDYWYTPLPVDVNKYERHQQINLLERRFRYLAADGVAVLQQRSQHTSYRQVLLRVCRYLKIRKYEELPTSDLESEIFLVLLEKTWQQLPTSKQHVVERGLQRAIASTQEFEHLPSVLQEKPISLLAKGGSALALSAVVRPWLLKQIVRQLTLHMTQYQVAKQVLMRGGLSAAAKVQSRAAVKVATYGAMRGVLAMVGPALWTWFLADLGWRAVATNYGRVIPAVFAIAQIRLIRSESSWVPV